MRFSDASSDFGSGQRSLADSMHIDVPLAFGLVLLILTSLFVLYSTSGQSSGMVRSQFINFVLGSILMLVLAQLNPQMLKRWSPWIYMAGVVILILVLIMGQIGKGAQRWLDLGIVRFQPSELMKLGVPMMVAWFLSEHRLPPDKLRVLFTLVAIFVPVLLIAKQPDLGTSLLVASAGIFALFFSGIRWSYIFTFVGLAAASTPVVWLVMRPYQRQRVITMLNPESDPLGAGYHIIQSKIAIGSGGVYGKGWLNGTQSQLHFLPERNTDFIFAAYSEEFGLFGVLLLLAIYMFILVRGLMIAAQAQDTYTRLLAGALIMTFFIYFFVNIGMVSGLLPVVGVPLPLISYGGTSVVTLMASFGILMSIQTHRKFLPR